MKIALELFAGPRHSAPTKIDMQKNIDAIQRAIDGKPLATDFVFLVDIISVLRAIQKQL